MPDDFAEPASGDAAEAVVPPARADDSSEASPPPEEHPAQARTTRLTTPTAGLRKLRIPHAPTLVIFRDLV
ncbi:hypothetical protein AB0M19_34920 [Streptomyces sp. NPDC051920]|uniref:hypothetical protein n=1 Tax=Streptomyces sp. NPDC051920 TaxID=3155523 RepID=UPI00342C6270